MKNKIILASVITVSIIAWTVFAVAFGILVDQANPIPTDNITRLNISRISDIAFCISIIAALCTAPYIKDIFNDAVKREVRRQNIKRRIAKKQRARRHQQHNATVHKMHNRRNVRDTTLKLAK